MEYKLRCVNFRRVSDLGRAYLLAFRVTGIWDEWNRSTMGVIVIGEGASRSTWEQWRQACKHQGAAVTSLGALRIRVEQSRKKNSFFGNAAGAAEIIATTYRLTIFKTHLFSLFSYLCIYIAIHLHMVYLDWLQVVVESNWGWAWKWRSSKRRDELWDPDRASLEMNLKAMVIWTWRTYSHEFGDTLGGCNPASLEICTWWP